MLRKTSLLLLSLLTITFASCARNGGLRNPFENEAPFVPTAVPADFAIVIDENHDTHFARQHIQQIITTDNAMSATTYTTFRDLNNAISSKFKQETPLSQVQLQNMWNETAKYGLLEGAHTWINWYTDADIYRKNFYIIQIRANGMTRTYRQTNGFSGVLRPLMLQVEAVRLPIGQDSKTPIVGDSSYVPSATAPAPTPATAPAMPATEPAATPKSAAPKPDGEKIILIAPTTQSSELPILIRPKPILIREEETRLFGTPSIGAAHN